MLDAGSYGKWLIKLLLQHYKKPLLLSKGPTQQIDSKINDLKQKQVEVTLYKVTLLSSHARFKGKCVGSPALKLVFNRVNGKRYHTPQPQTDCQGEGYTAAHEDNVKFVYEAWQEVEQRLGDSRGAENGHGPVQYTDKSPNPSLKSEYSIG
ncbi:MCRI2 protein, partial [Polyodon spathula]|nr:MCRI2 protein [Polyodon spathula]